MNALPDKALLRRGEVQAFLGVDERVLSILIAGGTVTAFYPAGEQRARKSRQGRAFFYRSQIEALAQQWKLRNNGVKHD